jgi:type II secretory pathway component PulJ
MVILVQGDDSCSGCWEGLQLLLPSNFSSWILKSNSLGRRNFDCLSRHYSVLDDVDDDFISKASKIRFIPSTNTIRVIP